MAVKIRYYDIVDYPAVLHHLKKDKEDFLHTSTGYTKRIFTKDKRMYFNDGGKDNRRVLRLINVVRNDGANWMKTNTVPKLKQEVDFFNLMDLVNHEDVIVKVDLKSAYWMKALKEGVITEKTNQKFLEWYKDIDPYFAKQDRLKALGALATTKTETVYKNGKRESELVTVEPTKDVYMMICDGVDRLMKDINYNCNGCIYYYWDCMFVNKKHSQEVIDYLANKGYDVGLDETKLEIVKLGSGTEYLRSTYDHKDYMTKKKNKHLLPIFDYED